MYLEISKEDIKAIEKTLKNIKSGVPKVLVTGINATLKTMNVEVRKRIGNDLNLKASRIADDMKVVKASYSKISGAIRVSGEPVGLIQFMNAKSRNFEGVTVKVKRNKRAAMIPHTFTAKGKSGSKKHVWWRAKKGGKRVGRMPIERLVGPRIPDIFGNEKMFGPMQTQSAHLLQTNTDKQVAELLRRAAL